MSLRTLLAAIVLAVSAVTLHAAQNPAPAADSNVTTIIHVTVVDVASGKELPDQTVVLQGDRIISLAPSDNSVASQGRVVDAQGAFLIPGLWDMHVHIQDLEDLPLYIANGVTGVRMMFGVKKPNELRARFAKEAAAPEVIIGSIIVDGDPPVWPGSIVIHNAKDARRVVDEIKASGADFVKIYNGIPRDAYFALVDEARKQNIPFAGHLPYQVRASEASDAGQRSIEHLDGIAIGCSRDELRLIQQLHPLRYLEKMKTVAEGFRSLDPARCQALFAQFRRRMTWQVPTLTVHRSMGYMDDSHFTSDPRVAYMSSEVRRRWDPSNDFRFRRWTRAQFEFHREIFNADKQLVGMKIGR